MCGAGGYQKKSGFFILLRANQAALRKGSVEKRREREKLAQFVRSFVRSFATSPASLPPSLPPRPKPQPVSPPRDTMKRSKKDLAHQELKRQRGDEGPTEEREVAWCEKADALPASWARPAASTPVDVSQPFGTSSPSTLPPTTETEDRAGGGGLGRCCAVFQQLDIDYSLGEPHATMSTCSEGPVPIIHIYGLTKEGHSAVLHVHGVMPYFYIPAPNSHFDGTDCDSFRQALNVNRHPFDATARDGLITTLLSLFLPRRHAETTGKPHQRQGAS